MESHDIDLEARQAQGPFVEERETENLSDGVPGVEQRERHAQQSTGTNACATAGNVSSGEEDETQLKELEAHNLDLRVKLKALQQPQALDLRARRLGMVKQGERAFVIENLPR